MGRGQSAVCRAYTCGATAATARWAMCNGFWTVPAVVPAPEAPLSYQALLSRAVECHTSQDPASALPHYGRALAAGLAQGVLSEIVFANYGALLRDQSRHREAAAAYRRGLSYFPRSLLLLRNYGNLLLEEGHAQAALRHFLEAEQCLPSPCKPGKREALLRQQAGALADLGFARLALRLLEPVLAQNPEDSALRLGMAELLLEVGQLVEAEALAGEILKQSQVGLSETFQQCNLLLRLQRSDEALALFEEATASHRRRLAELDAKTRLKYDSVCWNFALMLLRRGHLRRGWQLFEHGRRVPNGRGGMQRTVFKTHPAVRLPEWDGSDLSGKRLLINGEQGIGDVMMFTSLVPQLLEEAAHVGLVTYDRLASLYRRAFPACTIYDTDDYRQRKIPLEDWDLQVAMGSLPALRYPTLESYSDVKSFLVADPDQQQEFAARYHYGQEAPLVGFSWRGGGNAKQKRTKSLRLEDFLPLFRVPGIRWISLQYGNVNDELRRFSDEHGLDLLIPEDVDPLRDMDRWCALVANCTMVISAANTTIHGAGCLGVPTWVILGRDPDWRWLGDPGTPCYWYPSVQIVRQQRQGSWHEPIDELLPHVQALRSCLVSS